MRHALAKTERDTGVIHSRPFREIIKPRRANVEQVISSAAFFSAFGDLIKP
jgi:hypothetical protein